MSEFLATLPVEFVNGEPYRCCRAGDGSFMLYSIGTKQAGWAWRYPAK